MTAKYRVEVSHTATEDIERLVEFLFARNPRAARRAIATIEFALTRLESMPFAFRRAEGAPTPFTRELVIPFGQRGYVALFEIRDGSTVTVLAVRHQREDDYR